MELTREGPEAPWPYENPLADTDDLQRDDDAERWLLATILRHPEAIDAAADAGWRPCDMYSPWHEEIALTICSMAAAGHPVDVVTLKARMESDGAFRGGYTPLLLFELWQIPVNQHSASYYAARVVEKARLRRQQIAGVRLRQRASGPDADWATVQSWAEGELAGVVGAGGLGFAGDELRTLAEVAADTTRAEHSWVIPGWVDADDKIIVVGGEGTGKAGWTGTPVPTPGGWTTLGELDPGDRVFGPDGQPCQVIAGTPPMLGRPCYRVRFSDGAEIIADADHEWLTETAAERDKRRGGRLRTTKEIAATLHARGGHQLNHAIATCAPLQYPEASLPVDPWVLGYWLGNGHQGGGQMTGHADDAPGVAEAVAAAGYPVSLTPERGKQATRINVRLLAADLASAGVIRDRHIPEAYQRAPVPQRLALLRGLLDSDGTVSKRGQRAGRGGSASPCEFTSTYRRLADDVLGLLLGLGVKVVLHEGKARLDGRDMGPVYRLWFQTDLPVHRLPRKAARLTPLRTRRAKLRYITACDRVPSVPVRCIQVDRPDGMFVWGRECIPTHNSMIGQQVCLCAAGGVHPFLPGFRFEPQRSLVVDLELSPGILTRRARRFLPHAEEVGAAGDMCRIWHRPYGLDLRTADGQAQLTAAVRYQRPRLLSLGPMYKAGVAYGQAEGGDYLRVLEFLDRLKTRYGCALWLEQHAPMRQGQRPRDMRPIGSVIFQQWPDFGWALVPVSGAPHRFAWHPYRPPREERQQPVFVSWRMSGWGWPWEAEYADSTFPDRPAWEADSPRDITEPVHADEVAARRAAREQEAAAAQAGSDEPPF